MSGANITTGVSTVATYGDTITGLDDAVTEDFMSLRACKALLSYESLMKIAPPVFLIIGTVFNVISFIVFQRPNLRTVVTTLYYRSFVLSDVIVLNVAAWAVIARYHFNVTCCGFAYSCRIIQYIINVFMDVNAWDLCIVHFNAHGLVAYPHKAMVEWTIKRALSSVLAVIFIAGCVNLPVLLLPQISIAWAALKIVWSNVLAFVVPLTFNILINLTLQKTTHPENIGCCKLTSMAVIIISLCVINACLCLPFNIYQLLVAKGHSDDVILLPGFVTATDWRVLTVFFSLVTSCTVKFAVFRCVCPRFSGECNKAWGLKETVMRPLGYQSQKNRSAKTSHIHFDSLKIKAINGRNSKMEIENQKYEEQTEMDKPVLENGKEKTQEGAISIINDANGNAV